MRFNIFYEILILLVTYWRFQRFWLVANIAVHLDPIHLHKKSSSMFNLKITKNNQVTLFFADIFRQPISSWWIKSSQSIIQHFKNHISLIWCRLIGWSICWWHNKVCAHDELVVQRLLILVSTRWPSSAFSNQFSSTWLSAHTRTLEHYPRAPWSLLLPVSALSPVHLF